MIADRDRLRQKAREELRRTLMELPRLNRLLLMLAVDEGLTDAEIGEALNMEAATVTHMREKLMDILGTIIRGVTREEGD